MTNLLHRNGRFVRVQYNCSKFPRTTHELPMKGEKCIEIDGGIFEYLFRTVTNLSLMCNKFVNYAFNKNKRVDIK